MPKSSQCQVTVLMPLGLHMRPADMLAKTASQFQSRIELGRPNDHERFDCKSILSVMTVAAVQGTDLIVYAEGDDCEEAVAAIRQLFEDGFDELGPEAGN
jgi:phosphocarrier protein HPr